jgi:hypothetical protein
MACDCDTRCDDRTFVLFSMIVFFVLLGVAWIESIDKRVTKLESSNGSAKESNSE